MNYIPQNIEIDIHTYVCVHIYLRSMCIYTYTHTSLQISGRDVYIYMCIYVCVRENVVSLYIHLRVISNKGSHRCGKEERTERWEKRWPTQHWAPWGAWLLMAQGEEDEPAKETEKDPQRGRRKTSEAQGKCSWGLLSVDNSFKKFVYSLYTWY